MRINVIYVLLIVAIFSISGCSAAPQRTAALIGEYDPTLPRTEQRLVIVGMGAANVAAVIGTPDLVTGSADGDEIWIYEKVSNNVSYALDRGIIVGLIFGSPVSAVVSANTDPYAAHFLQDLLRVAIKFDQKAFVHDFSYTTSTLMIPIANDGAKCNAGARDVSNFCDRWLRYSQLAARNNSSGKP